MKRSIVVALLLGLVPGLGWKPTQEARPPTRWALLIGISDYIHFGDEPGGDLPGAEGDALALRSVLAERWGFPPDHIRMLLNREATKGAIQAAMTEWLPSVARPGDHVTVYFAGHGSQMWDEDGDEDDGLDETLAPADVLRESTEMDISDDLMREWLLALPTDNVVVILDNCNSGTGTRDVTPFSRTRELRRNLQALSKPPSMARRSLGEAKDATGFNAGAGRVLEISAAQPYQPAVDAFFPGDDAGEGFFGGAFTTFLVRELWRAPSGSTYEEVFLRVREALKRNRFEQDPYLSEDVGLKTGLLFALEGVGGGSAIGTLRVLTSALQGGYVELDGGRLLGITPGSLFRSEGRAELLVESLTNHRARARVLQGSVSQGAFAKLEAHRFTPSPLRVGVGGVDSATREALVQATVGLSDIQWVVAERDFSHLLIRREGTTLRVLGSDGAQRHVAPAGPGGAEALVAALKKEAAAKRLADMENPAPSFSLKVWLADHRTSFGIGEAVVFHAVSGADGYLTLVDLGTDGTVTILFPNPYDRNNRVRAGQEIVFPSQGMGSEIRALPPVGRGMVRAFLTPRPLELPTGEEFTTGDVLLADRIAEAVRRAVGEAPGAPKALRVDGWASASVIYDIQR